MRKPVRSLKTHPATHRQIRLPKIKKTTIPMRTDSMPTATLHSGLSNNKITTEPAATVPIQAHQARKSALPKVINNSISNLANGALAAVGERGNGYGSTSRRKSGGWMAQYFVYTAEGRKRRTVVYGKAREEVRQKLTKAIAGRDGGRVYTGEGIKRPRGTASPRRGRDSALPQTRRLVAGFRRGPQRRPLPKKRCFRR